MPIMGSPGNPDSRSKPSVAKLLFAAIFAVIAIIVVYTVMDSGPWIVPEAAKQLKNPLQPSQENLEAAHAVYLDKCAQCHGDSGRGDGDKARMYSPRPSNLTDAARLDRQTDGELFYKITHGHKPMPAFRGRLSDQQRWQLVLLMRFLSRPRSTTEKVSASH